MTEWSGPEFTYCSSAASNQATKPKLRGVHKVLQNQHQHCHDCKKPCFHFSLYFKAIINTAIIAETLLKHLSLSVPLARHSSEEDVPPFYFLLSMAEWSGPEFMYRSNAASNQATKPKLHGVHKVLQNQHQHRHDCKNLALTSLSVLLSRHTALRKMFPALTFCFW